MDALVGGAVGGGAVGGGDVAGGIVATVVGAAVLAVEVSLVGPVTVVWFPREAAVLGGVFFPLLATPAITAMTTMAATSAHIQGVLAIGRFDLPGVN